MDGLTSFANISATFPWISTCRLMASDLEVGHLNFLPHLCHLEVAPTTLSNLKILTPQLSLKLCASWRYIAPPHTCFENVLFRWNSRMIQALVCSPS